MKNLDNVLEGLLDADFDINVEPVLYKFKTEKFNYMFSRFVDNYNAIVVSYNVCNQAIDQLKKIVDDLTNFEPQTALIDNLAQGLRHTMLGYSSQISKKDYDYAINYLNDIRPFAKMAEDAEKALLKMKAPKNIILTLAPCDWANSGWCLKIYQERWVSGPNWVDANLDKLQTDLKKIKNAGTVSYRDKTHSIYIEGK